MHIKEASHCTVRFRRQAVCIFTFNPFLDNLVLPRVPSLRLEDFGKKLSVVAIQLLIEPLDIKDITTLRIAYSYLLHSSPAYHLVINVLAGKTLRALRLCMRLSCHNRQGSLVAILIYTYKGNLC